MQIYNNNGNSSNRRTSKCSYCRAEGHNATNCPRVAEDYAWFTKTPPVIPIGISATPNTCTWFKTPKYWGEWYEKCIDAHAKQQAAKKKASSSRTGTARSAPKCGFCGSKAHNRRNCDAMERYTADAIEANRNWRRTFYNTFVEQMGISEGALLNLKKQEGYGSNREEKQFIGIVTKVNWDELSLFCASSATGSGYCYRDHAYCQYLTIEAQVGNETVTISFDRNGFDVKDNKGVRNLVKHTGGRYSWNNPHFVSVLSPSETPLGEEWIEEGHSKAMAFLTKKRSKAKLDEAKVTELIQLWLK
jgi:hypothetical protein